MKKLLVLMLLGCSNTPQVIQLTPDKEPVCGFLRVEAGTAVHCCVAVDGPVLVAKCIELEPKQTPQKRHENPARDL